MAGKAARPRPAAALRQAVGDVKDLAGELGALAEGIAVTEAAREVVPLAPPPKGRRRDLGRLRPQEGTSRPRRAATDHAADTARTPAAVTPAPVTPAPTRATSTPTAPGRPARTTPPAAAAPPTPAPTAPGRPARATPPAGARPTTTPPTPARPAGAASARPPAPPPRVPEAGAPRATPGGGATSPVPPALAAASPADIFTPRKPAPPAHVELVDDVDPIGRPWTVAAAMEPIQGPASDGAYAGGVTEGERHPWLMTVVVVGAVLVAILVFVGSHLNLGSTQPVGFAVNGLRALHAQDDTSVTPDGHFTPATTSIVIQADYIGATKGDTLTVSVERDGAPLTDQSVTLDAAEGTATATLQSAGAGFAPGNYVVSAAWHKQALRTIAFVVDPPASPQPSP